MAKIQNSNILYVDANDLLPKRVDLHNIKRTDFTYEIHQQIMASEVVIFSTPGILPQLIKTKW